DALLAGIRGNEPLEDHARDVTRAGRLLQDELQGLVHVEGARAAEERLRAIVVLFRPELRRSPLDAPSREGARRLADVVLRVVADPEGEQLHQLAREVLVRVSAPVGVS